jgi:sterol desaturase/sphingolipid hydroxylase (fatty acid hydroxylase superfamily)
MSLPNTWLMTKRQYFVDFFTIPLFIIAALLVSVFVSWQFVFGFFAWGFSEYVVHRFVFHRIYRREHWLHHADVLEYIGIQGWKIFSIYFVGFLVAYFFAFLPFFAGYALGYLSYISMHYFIHRPETTPAKWMTKLIKNHNLHHEQGIEKNFGVTSPIWDYIFRTKV